MTINLKVLKPRQMKVIEVECRLMAFEEFALGKIIWKIRLHTSVILYFFNQNWEKQQTSGHWIKKYKISLEMIG